MLDQLTNEYLAKIDSLDLIVLILRSPPQTSLEGLPEPSFASFVLGSLTEPEKKLAAAFKSLTDRAENLFFCESATMFDSESVDSEEAVQYDALCNHLMLVYETLDTSMSCRLSFNARQYVHLIPANDGLIYGCVGSCQRCLSSSAMSGTHDKSDSIELNS